MTHGAFVALAAVLVEGAVDAFCGRPKSANPYSYESARDGHWCWAWGHDEATAQIELRGQAEAARWLREAA